MLLSVDRFVWIGAAMLTAVLLARPAAAQDRSRDQSGDRLAFSASIFGGYRTDVSNAPTPELQTSAPYGGTTLTIDYRSLSEKITIVTRGSADSRHYRTQPALTSIGV